MTPTTDLAKLVELDSQFRRGRWMPISDWHRYAVMEENHPHERMVCTVNQMPVSMQGRKIDHLDYCGADRTVAEFICAAHNSMGALRSLLDSHARMREWILSSSTLHAHGCDKHKHVAALGCTCGLSALRTALESPHEA